MYPGPVNDKEEAAPNANQSKNEPLHEWRVEGDVWTAVFTGGLFVVTTALAFFTFRLWRSTSDLVRGAADTAKRQLRAYIFLHDAKLAFTTMDGPFYVHIELRNSGQTPAHNVSLWFKIDWFEYPLQSALSSEAGPGETVAPIAANTVITRRLQTTGALTDKMREDLMAERKAIYVNGRVSYTDIFGERYTTKIKCLCTGEDLNLKRLRVARDGNEETDG